MLHFSNILLNDFNGVPVYQDLIYKIYLLNYTPQGFPVLNVSHVTVRCLFDFIWFDLKINQNNFIIKKSQSNLSLEQDQIKWFEEVCNQEIPKFSNDVFLNNNTINSEVNEIYTKWFEDMCKFDDTRLHNLAYDSVSHNNWGKKSWVRYNQKPTTPFNF